MQTQDKKPAPGRYPVPEPTLRRLPWYLAYVSMLEARNVEHISSTAIAKEINVDAAQIAKDLSVLDIKGKTRIGYEVKVLEKALKDFLGFDREHRAVIVGVGSLGSALMADKGLERYGLNIMAGFDIDSSIIGNTIKGKPIYHIDQLKEKRRQYDASIGIVAVPVENAQQVANLLVEAGVSAIWNYTPFRIRTDSGVVIQNTSIYAHLAVMYNRILSGK